MKKSYLKTYFLLLGIIPFGVLAQEAKMIDAKGNVRTLKHRTEVKDKSQAKINAVNSSDRAKDMYQLLSRASMNAGASDYFESQQHVTPESRFPTRFTNYKIEYGNSLQQNRQLAVSFLDQIISEEFIDVLDLSADGTRLVVGTDGNDENGLNAGSASVYENLSGDWIQIGSSILGEAEGDNAGYAVSISGDGSTVAVASLANNLQDTTGYVRVFQYNSGAWEQIGQAIQGASAGDGLFYRENIALNQDGTILAFSSDSVNVYRLEMDTWVKDPEVLIEGSHNVSISADGNTLIAGSAFGSAELFVYDGFEWFNTSNDFQGGFYGFSVDLSPNGQFAAVGSVFDGVYLYEIDDNDVFQLINYFMSPPGSVQFGWDVSVENSGSKVAVADNFDTATEIYANLNGFWYVQDNISFQSNAVSFDEAGSKIALGGGTIVNFFDVFPDQNTSVSVSDSLALVELYEATSDSGWISSTNWLVGPVVTWRGVTVENNQVTELQLEFNNLSGSLPASIGNLDLTRFDVSDNQLIGSIPSEIGNWTDMTYFDVRSNQLTGSIPDEIGNLSQLTSLELYNNQLSGEIPLGLTNLTSLQRLSAGQNQFSGSIPPEIGNLTNLHTLYLWGNNLTGTLPAELGSLTNIIYMEFSQNQLSGEIPRELGNLNNMRTLYLWENNLTGDIPPEFGNLSSIVNLDLGTNELTGEIPPELGSLSNVRLFDVNNNNLDGALPSEFGNLTSLELLYIRDNQFNGLPDLNGLTALNVFDVSYNRIPDADIELNASVITRNDGQFLPILASDSLALVSIYDAMGGEFWNQSTWFNDIAATWEGVGTSSNRVTSLDLDVLGAFGELPDEIADLDALQVLNISGTGAQSINQGIQSLEDLYYLDVSLNRLTFDDLSPFADFVTDTNKTLIYNSQGLITEDELIVLESPSTITTSVPAFNGASYRWFNDDTELSSTSNTVTFDLATDNRVNLRAEASHPNFPDLILSSGIVRGRVNYFNTEYKSIDPYFSFDAKDSIQHRYRNSLAHDFNGDGFDDLIVLKNSNEISYYSGSPNGLEFEGFSDFEINNRFYQDLHMGDYNGDGMQDVIINLIDSLNGLRQYAFFVFDGSQPFGNDPASILLLGTEGIYNEGFPIPGNNIGDVDGDGSDEFFFGTILSNAKGYIVDIASDFSISYRETTSLDYSFGCRVQGLGDISGDGIDDFAVSTFQDDVVSIFRGNASGNFASADFSMNFDANHLRTGDFNGDEFPDVAISFFNVPNLEVDKLINIYYGGTSFDLVADASFNVTSQPMNGEFELELVSGSLEFEVIKDPSEEGLDDFVFFTPFGSNGVMVEMENSEESMIPSIRYNSVFERPLGRSNNFVNTYRKPAIGDFNSDGIPDILVTESDTTAHVYSAYVNVAPVIEGESITIDENSENGLVVGSVVVTDVNSNVDLGTLAIVAGNTNEAFALVDNEIQIADSAQIDFETNPVFELTLEVTDRGGLQGVGQIVIEILNVNETPAISDATFEINELLEAGTEVGSVEFSDPEEDDLVLVITDGNTDDAFSIDAQGVLTVNNANAIDIDDNPSFELTIEVSDDEFTVSSIVSIVLLNVNEAPIIADATFEINGKPEANAEVGVLEFSDPDNDDLTLTITEGNIDELFAINDEGVITVTNPDGFTSNDPFELTVEATDGEFTAAATVNIVLNNVLGLGANDLRIYPNPTHSKFMVENLVSEKITSIHVTDLSGKVIPFNFERISLNRLDMQLLTESAGIFILRIETDSKVIVKKITKL